MQQFETDGPEGLSSFTADIEGALSPAFAGGPPRVPLSSLPPLQPRGFGYRIEPWIGILTVMSLSGMLVGVTQAVASSPDASVFVKIANVLIWAEAAVAVLCMLALVCGNAGIVERSMRTCYPMPTNVEERLLANMCVDDIGNIKGPAGHPMMGSYCVRCFVWRPSNKGPVHHCRTCSRCVTGFDHHCGVFGRCIVQANMTYFVTLIGMMFAGIFTAMAAAIGGPMKLG